MQKAEGATTFPGILWGMLWRSTVLFPVALIVGVAAVFSWLGVLFFPSMAVLYAYTGDWLMAGLHLGLL